MSAIKQDVENLTKNLNSLIKNVEKVVESKLREVNKEEAVKFSEELKRYDFASIVETAKKNISEIEKNFKKV